MSSLVQYIVLRKDLKWPAGALIAQACHAATAVIFENYDDHLTLSYLKDIDNMHKIVLECDGEKELNNIQLSLAERNINTEAIS
ncbi:hypothetical protein ACOME3_010419 [Neoechinorhynchus agilis]